MLDAPPPPAPTGRPWVILVTGVNGVGKTTTIGKLGARQAEAGRRVLFVAADTFRAAAVEQLAVWSERTGAVLVRQAPGADPSAVAFDGMKAALAREIDIVLVDTAGRLHTRTNLMAELAKVRRIIGREVAGAPHETLLVLDATTGQNAIAQARSFLEAAEVSSTGPPGAASCSPFATSSVSRFTSSASERRSTTFARSSRASSWTRSSPPSLPRPRASLDTCERQPLQSDPGPMSRDTYEGVRSFLSSEQEDADALTARVAALERVNQELLERVRRFERERSEIKLRLGRLLARMGVDLG